MSEINGNILIGATEERGQATFQGRNPATGESLPGAFAEAGVEHASAACALAAEAFPVFSTLSPADRAAFLESVAEHILGIGDALIIRAMEESGLPRARLEGERGRTVGQLRLFASVLRQGDWLEATIDPAMPDRAPLPRPDIRRVNQPVGPVVVFGASNFPLAFSVAGGDTASAFAAGCPVVVKGHPAHPGTGELVARAIQAAVAASGLPAGTFSYLPGTTQALGAALVADPRVKAVGFTGSRAGGLALVEIARNRPEPIPVYAEMSSINPVLLLPTAAAKRGADLGAAFIQSLTMGAGQFCTNPGLVVALEGADTEAFIAAAAQSLTSAPAQVMLSEGIWRNYCSGIDLLAGNERVTLVARGQAGEEANRGQAALFRTDADAFLADPTLSHEVFGSSSLVIVCRDVAEVKRVLAGLEGQLTSTLLMDPEDQALAGELLPLLTEKSGRVLANGWPTGVEVCHAMVHGGPFPATSDVRTTSVGTLAMVRFLRPVCYQNIPDALLPPALQAANPWGLTRRVNGTLTPA
ncbi:aldehyde dehydrogenase (NADP(+)) [Niveispirillum irakense]|uniref:aldehyde dehydrogenase (NADP(+)) n=1 Tax=Niveispirillum irakense TaxID=34011 RepID=UPI000428A01C|nr:aldehyde dehydrogenase (NADP(+)) [Niveispirillum irakense]